MRCQIAVLNFLNGQCASSPCVKEYTVCYNSHLRATSLTGYGVWFMRMKKSIQYHVVSIFAFVFFFFRSFHVGKHGCVLNAHSVWGENLTLCKPASNNPRVLYGCVRYLCSLPSLKEETQASTRSQRIATHWKCLGFVPVSNISRHKIPA